MTTDSTTPDPYQVLGLTPDASETQVRKAWRKKTAATGPGTPEFAALNAAAELLLDRDRRQAYDGERAAARLAERAAQADAASTQPTQPTQPTELAELAEPPAADTEPAEAGAPDPAAPQRGTARLHRGALSGWNGTIAVAGVLVLVALALAVWQGIDYANRTTATPGRGTGGVPASNFQQSQSDQDAALSAVNTGLPAVLSYNYSSMPAALANGKRFLTARAQPAFVASFQRLIQGGPIPGCTRPLAPIATRKTVVTATVVQAGVVSVSGTTAQIGAFVNQTTTTATQSPVTTHNRVLVTLVKQNGTWLIDSLSVPNTDHVLHC